MPEIADKSAVDGSYEEMHLNDKRPGLSAAKDDQDLPISDVHLSMVETVDTSTDVRRAGTSRPDADHIPNAAQQISMQSKSPSHEVHRTVSFLHAVDRVEVQCTSGEREVGNDGTWYSVETCEKGSNWENVVYKSGQKFSRTKPWDDEHLQIRFGGQVFHLGQFDWRDACHLECIMTKSQEKCTNYLISQSGNRMWSTSENSRWLGSEKLRSLGFSGMQRWDTAEHEWVNKKEIQIADCETNLMKACCLCRYPESDPPSWTIENWSGLHLNEPDLRPSNLKVSDL